MGVVLTNSTNLQYAVEETLGVLPTAPIWKQVEPNTINTLGATITTVARSPISRNRQARKGTVTDLDAAIEYEADLTNDSFNDFAEGFIYATGTFDTLHSGALGENLAADDALTIGGTPPGFTHDALTAALPAGRLIYARGFTNVINNGLFAVGASGSTTETPVTGSPSFVAETPSNEANATLEIAGWRFTDLTWTDATDTIGSVAVDLTTIGLVVGQTVHIGGLAAGQQFTNGVAFGRVRTIAANTITLDKVTGALKTAAADQTAAAVDLLFGTFIRNVPVGTAGTASNIPGATNRSAFIERSYQFETAWDNLFDGPSETGYEYNLGNFANQLAWALPLTDKSTATFSFVGTDAEPPVRPASRKTNAATPRQPVQTTAYNTSADFVRLRVQDASDNDVAVCFKDLTLTLLNNVSPEKALGTLGAKFVNYGNFDVTFEGAVIFTSPTVISAIRNNDTVTFDMILRNVDGGISVDFPSLTLGDGGRDLPVNESVQVALTGTAVQDSTFNTSIGITVFPVLPQS